MTRRHLNAFAEAWPLKEPFVIARGSRIETSVITVTIKDGDDEAWGESVPLPRYGESIESVIADIQAIRSNIEAGIDRKTLLTIMRHGAARNAVDNALWDLEAKKSGKAVAELAGVAWPENILTVQTISIGPPEAMHDSALRYRNYKTLKVKLNAEDIVARIEAVRKAAPNSTLIIDANESWNLEILKAVTPQLAKLGVAMIEQPLPAGEDAALEGYESVIPLCADESCHTSADLDGLIGKYAMVNIKLDKTGGLTEAFALLKNAKDKGFDIMVGCMVSTSLGIAPAMFIACEATYVDLDAPALLSKDRVHAVKINQGLIETLSPDLWGGALTLA